MFQIVLILTISSVLLEQSTKSGYPNPFKNVKCHKNAILSLIIHIYSWDFGVFAKTTRIEKNRKPYKVAEVQNNYTKTILCIQFR
jgi:hypothetical protein